jgi:hypothetical protein
MRPTFQLGRISQAALALPAQSTEADSPRNLLANKNLIATPLQTRFPATHRKQTTVVLSNPYKIERSFAARPPLHFRFLFANNPKINRHTEKLEHLVSRRKQRTGPPINRHTSRGPCFLSPLLTFPFSHRHLALLMSFSSHSPLVSAPSASCGIVLAFQGITQP